MDNEVRNVQEERTEEKGTTIQLGRMDAAIVFHQDGSIEGTLPMMRDEDFCSQGMIQAAAVCSLFSGRHPELLEKVLDLVSAKEEATHAP